MYIKEEQAIKEICQNYCIQYALEDIDFIEKDTRYDVNLDIYTLLVIKDGEILKLDGFYSIDKINGYLAKAKGNKAIYEDDKELIGYILVNNKENIKDFFDFASSYEQLNNHLIRKP